jgi:hypothetical protein
MEADRRLMAGTADHTHECVYPSEPPTRESRHARCIAAMPAIAFVMVLCVSACKNDLESAWGESLKTTDLKIKDPEIDPDLRSDGTPESLISFRISVPESWRYDGSSSAALWRSPDSVYPSFVVDGRKSSSKEEEFRTARTAGDEILREEARPDGLLVVSRVNGPPRALVVWVVRLFDSGVIMRCSGFEYGDDAPEGKTTDRLSALCDGIQLL